MEVETLQKMKIYFFKLRKEKTIKPFCIHSMNVVKEVGSIEAQTCVCVCLCAPLSLDPPWELGVLELEELPLLVFFSGVSREMSVLRRSGLLRQHKHSAVSFIQKKIRYHHVCEFV